MLLSSVTVALIIPSGSALVLWDYSIDANGLMFIPLSVNLCLETIKLRKPFSHHAPNSTASEMLLRIYQSGSLFESILYF